VAYAANHGWDMVFAMSFAGSPRWRSRSKSATPKHIFGVPLSQLLRQWRIWRTIFVTIMYVKISLQF